MKLFKNKTFLTIIALLAFFIITDFVLGNIMNRRTINFFRIKHNYYHHGLLKSQASLGAWAGYNYPVYTNNMGFRDTTRRKVNIYPKKKQVLLLGDSHTEGVGVFYENCFPTILNKSVPGIQFHNASAVSYSPKLHYLRLKYFLDHSEFIPDEIVVMIDLSDIQNEIIYENYIPAEGIISSFNQKAYEFFHRNSFIYFRTRRMISMWKQQKFSRESEIFEEYVEKSQFRQTFSMYADFFDNFDDQVLVSDPAFHNVGDWMYNENYKELYQEGLQLGAENILQIKEITDSLDIKLHVSIHPWSEQIARQDTSDSYVKFWQEVCTTNNIHFINLYPAFIYPKISLMTGGGFFIPNDNHWNELGHRVVAMELQSKFIAGSPKRR